MPARSSQPLRAAVLAAALVVGGAAPAALAQQPGDTSVTTVAPAVAADPTVTTAAATAQTEPSLARTRLDDPESRRAINLLIGSLAALAVVLAGVSVWYWRATRPIAAALEPLAVMSTRRFRHKPADEQEGELHAIHELKAATDPPPRAADLLRQVRGDE